MTRATAARRGGSGSAADPQATEADAAALLDEFSHALPALIVFDLDYTLWPFWCEMFSASSTPWLFPEVPAILDALRARGVALAVASRTPTPHVANAFIDKLDLRHRFCSLQLIPAADGCDTRSAQKDKEHLPNIRRDTGLRYEDMLFFDDEHGNIRRARRRRAAPPPCCAATARRAHPMAASAAALTASVRSIRNPPRRRSASWAW